MKKRFAVYITANKSGSTIYIGVTSSLAVRIDQHKRKEVAGFTSRYNVTRLVYYEIFEDAYSAISREKQLKRWSRKKKMDLIKSQNPEFKDLSDTLE